MTSVVSLPKIFLFLPGVCSVPRTAWRLSAWVTNGKSEETLKKKEEGIQATTDLGQIYLGAVENEEGRIVSKRSIRSEKQLFWAKKKAVAHTRRKIRGLRHKVTRQIVSFCNTNTVS